MIGIDDEDFVRGKVPMTKREIRILTLANANIGVNDYIVDVGAGTGSISIEAALIATGGHIFALERNSDAIHLIKQNAERFSVKNISIINAEAPDGLHLIPRIDVAIIGGSGGFLQEILQAIDAKLKTGGRIVMNFITVQSLAMCLNWFKNHTDYKYSAIQVQINRLKNLGFYDMAEAINPVHIVTAKKICQCQMSNLVNFSDAKSKFTHIIRSFVQD